MEKLRLIELCSGIGAQHKGLSATGLFDVESVATCDLDKEVVVSYAAIHCGLTPELIENYEYPTKAEMIKELTDKRIGYDFAKDKPYDWARLAKRKDKIKGIEKYWLADKLSRNLGDMVKVTELPDCDLLTYSTPCVSFSQVGKQEGSTWTCQDCGHKYEPYHFSVEERYHCPECGGTNIKSTASGLLYEVERLLVKAKNNGNLPKYLLMENVEALVSKKFIDGFNDWVSRLDALGYNSYYKVLNGKYCGTAQNRPRIFVISILKEIDAGKFTFSEPYDSGLRLIDYLEDEVDPKYYLSDEVQRRLQITDETLTKNIVGTTKPEFRTIGQRDLVYRKDAKVIGALVSTDYKQPKELLENMPNERFFRQVVETLENNDVEVGDTIDAFNKRVNKSGNSPTLTTRPDGFKTAVLPIVEGSPNKPIHVGDLDSERFQKMFDQSRRVYDEVGIAPALHTRNGGNQEPKISINNLRYVRKITPLECHRLMNFDDYDYWNCVAVGMSDSQGYVQAGNSIIVNCIKLLGEHLYKAQYDENYVCTDENFTKPQAD